MQENKFEETFLDLTNMPSSMEELLGGSLQALVVIVTRHAALDLAQRGGRHAQGAND